MSQRLYFAGLVFLLMFAACSGGQKQQKIFTGVVEGTMVQVPALTGGKIINLYVNTGDTVQAGKNLAQLDTADLHFQRQKLEGALDEIRIQEQMAVTQLKRAENDLKYVQEKYQRFTELLKSESVPRQTVDDLANRLQAARSAYQTAQQHTGSIAARKKQMLAQYRQVIKKISDAAITAPLSGTVSQKFYEAGEAVPPMTPLLELIDLREVWVKIYLSEKMLPHIKIGQQVEVQPDGLDRSLSGKIGWISPKAEFTPKTILTPETRTSLVYAVKILIPNPNGILKHGMPVEIRL